MKKYIIFMLAMFMAFVSCYQVEEGKKASEIEYENFRRIYLTSVSESGEKIGVDCMRVYEIDMDGHSFYLLRMAEGGLSLEHKPDCPCHNKNTNTSIDTKPDSTGSFFDIW